MKIKKEMFGRCTGLDTLTVDRVSSSFWLPKSYLPEKH